MMHTFTLLSVCALLSLFRFHHLNEDSFCSNLHAFEPLIAATACSHYLIAAQEGRLNSEMASMVKYHATELESRVADACVQLHGGYGYMW